MLVPFERHCAKGVADHYVASRAARETISTAAALRAIRAWLGDPGLSDAELTRLVVAAAGRRGLPVSLDASDKSAAGKGRT